MGEQLINDGNVSHTIDTHIEVAGWYASPLSLWLPQSSSSNGSSDPARSTAPWLHNMLAEQ